MTNTTTGARQTIDLEDIVMQAGEKVIDFDELGVTLTLNGAAESDEEELARALDRQTITARSGLTGAGIRVTNTTTGATELVSLAGLADSAGQKTLNFSALGVTLGLSGRAESFAGELALALALNGTSVTATPRQGFAHQVTVTDATTGRSETVVVSGAPSPDGSRLLTFDKLGVTLEIDSDEGAKLDETLAKLQGKRAGGSVGEAAGAESGRTVSLFGEEEGAGSISAEALAQELDAALQQAEQEALALRTEIRTATRELGLAPGTSSVDPEFNSAAVAAEILTASPALLSGHVALGSQAALRLLAP